MKNIYIISLIAICLASISCTERIDVELGSTYQRVVIFGTITNEAKAHSVKITQSSDYFTNSTAVGISDATVTIDDGSSTIRLSENPAKPGEYLTPSNYQGIPGKTYAMIAKIKNNGSIQTYSASSLLKAPLTMDSIHVERNNDRKGWDLKLFAYEPPTKDYYMFRAHKNKVLLSDTITEPTFTDDELVNGRYSYGFPAFFLDELKPDEIIKKGDLIGLEICSINKDFLYFLYDIQQETQPKSPLFSGPSANIRTNIVGDKVFGFFTAYSSSITSTVYNGN